MFRTKDKLLTIEGVENVSDIIFKPSDWSVVNLPPNKQEAEDVFTHLNNTPGTSHLSLVVFRQLKKHRVSSLLSLSSIGTPWEYMDTISMTYGKPSSCSSNGFLPIAEAGVLFYKGVVPEVKRTAWFGADYENATNFWDLGIQHDEPIKTSYYQKFSWEMHLLLKSMCGNLEHRAFTYTPFVTESEIKSIHKFCQSYQLRGYVYAKSNKEAEKLLKECEK